MRNYRYIFGGWYGEGKDRKFQAVTTSNGEVYHYDDYLKALEAFNLTRHHSHFFKVRKEDGKVILQEFGDCFFPEQKTETGVGIPEEQRKQIFSSTTDKI